MAKFKLQSVPANKAEKNDEKRREFKRNEDEWNENNVTMCTLYCVVTIW